MILVNREICIRCRKCENACPFGTVVMRESFPEIGADCVECGECVRACPAGAITRSEAGRKAEDLSEYRGFMVVSLEEDLEKPAQVTLQLLSEARRLADQKNTETFLLLAGSVSAEACALAVGKAGCDVMIRIEYPSGSSEDPAFLTSAITEAIQMKKPEAVLFPATPEGRDLAPKVCCRLRTGLTADCTGLEIDPNGNLLQIRPTYGGSIMAEIITPHHRPQMASVRPNVLEVVSKQNAMEPRIETVRVKNDDRSSGIVLEQNERIDSAFGNLEEARIVIAGGYGLRNKENFQKLISLCRKYGAAAAATRKAVDEGWAPADIQVGQTGKTVAPDLYIAFGISGALQHTLGMNRAKKIIAVNNDPAAPVFDAADVAILGDAASVLEELLASS